MNRSLFVVAAGIMLLCAPYAFAGTSSASYNFNGNGLAEYPNEGYITCRSSSYSPPDTNWGDSASIRSDYYNTGGNTVNYTVHSSGSASPLYTGANYCVAGYAYMVLESPSADVHECATHDPPVSSVSCEYEITTGANLRSRVLTTTAGGHVSCIDARSASGSMNIIVHIAQLYNITGDTDCVSYVNLVTGSTILETQYFDAVNTTYDFTSLIEGFDYSLVFSNGVYYDFTCDGNEVFDYDACTWVYGYTCGIDTIKLYKDDGGWVLTDTESPGVSWSTYEMPIINGCDYLISFLDGGTVCYNETFSCTGNHVLIDFDRCNWVWPPSPWGTPIIIYLYTGHDYNIVVFKDEHGNFIENSQLAIYDTTDDQYIQRWADASEGYTLLGARFDTDHEVKLMLRTFDGVFTLDADHPANGTALVGEENITTTNWTIPIKYNLNVLPIDTYGVPLFDVFCGLSEYTPLNPGSFWGMDLSDQGYVAVTNCSGFSMCDIVAEKEGYADYRVEALNWTSKSAMVKDYRHNVVMEEE